MLARRTLEELSESVDYGVTASAKTAPVGPKFLRITDIQDDRVDWATVPFCDVPPEEVDGSRLSAGDIVFARTGATTGKSFLLKECPDGAVFASYLIRVRPLQSEVDPRYLAWYFQTPDYWRQITSSAAGTAQPGVNATKLKSLSVPTTTLTEQRRVADILDKADAARRKRKDAIALTEALLRSTFLETFGDPVTNPMGWPVKPLRALGTVTTGNTPSRDIPEYFGDAIEWIKSDNINTPSHYLTPAVEGLSERGRAVGRVAPAGSTLMTCIAGSPDCIGNVGLADREVAFNQQINAVTPSATVDHRWLYVLLLLGKRLVQGASTNSMKGMVSKGKLEQVVWPVPPREQQKEFGALFDAVLTLKRRQEAAAGECDALFGSLAQRAFRGELGHA
jgi:type I restriction enzyme S subunit